MTASLLCKTSVKERIPPSGRGPLPDSSTRMSPITSSLILGSHDAVRGR